MSYHFIYRCSGEGKIIGGHQQIMVTRGWRGVGYEGAAQGGSGGLQNCSVSLTVGVVTQPHICQNESTCTTKRMNFMVCSEGEKDNGRRKLVPRIMGEKKLERKGKEDYFEEFCF